VCADTAQDAFYSTTLERRCVACFCNEKLLLEIQTHICGCIIIGLVYTLGCNVRPRSVDYCCLSAGSRQTCLLRAGGKGISVYLLVNVGACN
jgi:hypothetical protein